MKRVTPGVGEAFGPVEEALQEIFVPALFIGLSEGLPGHKNTCLTVYVGAGGTFQQVQAHFLYL